jgi:6-pyruvoyltetrahydropterin/6-carboxytetrahydropterin synthase
MKFQSTKLYDGYSACFRQWKADGTHCKYLHSYILSFQIIFNHDEENIFKLYPEFERYLKQWFQNTFDHKTFISKDDPYMETFERLDKDKIIQLHILDAVGCERFSEFVCGEVNNIINEFDLDLDMTIKSVETFEHSKNSALFIK